MSAWTAAALAALLAFAPAPAEAAERPSCVLMKFTDDTRYDAIESAAALSDLLMNQMMASGRFQLQETYPLGEDMERQLYDEKAQEMEEFEAAMADGDFSRLFEGPGFSESKAQSIATASEGQIVTPAITRQIGAKHGADYLIQGTILNLGTGNWWSQDHEAMSLALNTLSTLVTSPAAAALGGALGPLAGLLGSAGIQRVGIGVQCDVRVIKASTGEVVWCKRVLEIQSQQQIDFGGVKFGSAKLSNALYAKAMEKAAKKIIDAMLADMDANRLFAK